VVDLVAEKKRRGVAIVASVHDPDVRDAIGDAVVDVSRFSAAA
jgi:alpha-D-ribose 1-methylphosphonate 5-triphosphate synthase subunit PhnL